MNSKSDLAGRPYLNIATLTVSPPSGLAATFILYEEAGRLGRKLHGWEKLHQEHIDAIIETDFIRQGADTTFFSGFVERAEAQSLVEGSGRVYVICARQHGRHFYLIRASGQMVHPRPSDPYDRWVALTAFKAGVMGMPHVDASSSAPLPE